LLKVQKDVNKSASKNSSGVPNAVQGVTTIVGERAGVSSDSEPVEVKESFENIIDSLIVSLETRVSRNEINRWIFSVGLKAGKTYAEIADEAKLRHNLNELKQLFAAPPPEISPSFLGAFIQISTLDDDGKLDAADKERIKAFVVKLR
jgi:hypothetical protein